MQNENVEGMGNSTKISCESINTKVESWLKGGHESSNTNSQPARDKGPQCKNVDLPFIVVEQIQCIPAEDQVIPQSSDEGTVDQNEVDALILERNMNLLKVVDESKNQKPTIHSIAKMKSWIKHWKTQVHVSDYTVTNNNETMSELLATVIPPEQLLSIIHEALPIVQNIGKLYRWQLGRNDRLTLLADSQIIHIQTLEKNITQSLKND